MDTLALEKIKEILLQNNFVTIVVSQNPNLDQMAGALGLYLSLLLSGKKASVVCPTEPIVEISSLVGIDKVKTKLEGENGDLTVSFPYKEGEIEKISYTLEDGFLNIIVKAGEKGLSFDQNDIRYKRQTGGAKVVFAIGASRLSDLGTITEIENLKDTIIINLDNKADNQGFGDIVLLSRGLSISEEVAKIIDNLSLKIDLDASQNLMSGICFATDNFQNPKTSPLAFEMAGFLMKQGAVRNNKTQNIIARELTEKKTFASPTLDDLKKTKTGSSHVNPPEDWLTPKIYKGSTSV